MTGVRRMVISLVGTLLVVGVVACQAAAANAPLADAAAQPVASATQPVDGMIWGKVPYCNCLATSATANVADALKKAKLTVNLKELSPSDGWLYFAVTFDPTNATNEQVTTAMQAGGAEVVAGPP